MFQVTDAVVEAHLATTINTYKAIDEANRKISIQKQAQFESMAMVWKLRALFDENVTSMEFIHTLRTCY